MQGFMIAFLICSLTMSALALFYMAVTPLLAKRYSAKSRYYTWLIIVVGLIIPFRPQFEKAFVNVSIPNEATSPIIEIGNNTPIIFPLENAPLTAALPSISWWQIATIIWLVGMTCSLVYHTTKHYLFIKMVKRWSEPVTDDTSIAMLQSIKSDLKINQQIGLAVCPCIGSPMLVGFVNPKVLIPQLDFAKDELCFILQHELVHFKHKDLWYKSIVLLATAMHWFNTIVYLMAKAIDVSCELSCDDEVVRSTSADTRLHYSKTIIGVVKYQSKMRMVFSTNFYGGKKGMKKRIFSIMDTGKKKAGLAVICGALIVILGTGAAFAANASATTPQAIGYTTVLSSDK